MKIGLVVQLFCSFSFVFAAKAPVTSAKSKLCGNDKCDEILFKAKVKRVMGSTHEAFLSLTEGALIDVTAVKFSDRTDLMEGVLADGSRGNFYIGAIDIGSYIEFLRNAIQQKKELKEISQDRNDVGTKKVLGAVRADLHLVRDYNVQARRYAEEQRLPEPELFPLSDPMPSKDNSHGHSHGNSHGHSHGDSHGHSHGDNHGHSHGDGHGHSHGDSTGHSHGSDHTTPPHYVGHLHQNDLSGQPHEPISSETKHAAATVVTESTATTSAPPPQPTNAHPAIHKKENIPTPRTENQLHIPTPSVDQLHASTPPVEDLSHLPTPPVDQLHVSTPPVGQLHVSTPPVGNHPPPPVENQHLSTPPVGQLHVSTPVGNHPPPPVENQHLSTPPVGQLHVSTPPVDSHPHIPTPPVENQSPIPTPPVENQSHTPATPVENQSQTQINGTQLHLSSTPISPVAEPLSAADVIVPTLQAEKLKVAEKLKIEMPEIGTLDAKSGPALETKFDSRTEPSSTPPSVRLDHVQQVDLAVRDKREDTQGIHTVDSQEGEPTTDSNSVTLQPSTTLSPSDFDVHVSTSDTPVRLPESVEFGSREKGPSDGDAVPLAGNQSPTEKEHHSSTLEDVKELLNTSNAGNSSNTVRELLKSLTGAIRTVSFMNAIDDAGIGFILNLSLLVAAVLFHCVSYFLSDINESSVCDTMIAHDLGTKCKLLDELNKSKDMEINRLGSVAGRSQGSIDEAAELRKEVCMKEAKIQNCLRNCENLKSELEEERRSREFLENNLETERKQAAQVEECVADLRRRLFDSEQAYISATKELTAARQASEALERDLREERQSYEEVAADLKKAKDVAEKLRMDLQSANEEVKKLTSEKSNMELENATLSAMIEEAERIRKEGSGGSGGWSDFGDDIVEPVDEVRESTTALAKVASPVTALGPVTDVRELTKLRVQLRKTEHELETVRVALENEKEERRRADSKLTSLEADLERRTKEVEERERDRSRADERCNELLALVKDGNIKVKETEQLRDKLWNDIAVLQSELASRAEDKRKKDEKISNLELELKRMRSEHLKLETRRFNEVLELKHKLDMMQTSQMQPLVPTTHGYDFLTKPERDDAPSPASLWEEAPRPMSCNRAATPEEDLLYGAFPAKKAHPRTRRSERAQLSNSPSDREKRKESHRRVRSRSHGRLWNGRSNDAIMRYLPMEPPYPHSFIPSEHMGYEMESSSHHRNRTVQVSSGGSNGGRSPPPEMPLLSAVPPPGLKKPAGKRMIDPEMEMKP